MYEELSGLNKDFSGQKIAQTDINKGKRKFQDDEENIQSHEITLDQSAKNGTFTPVGEMEANLRKLILQLTSK